jgi:hypothetical protein
VPKFSYNDIVRIKRDGQPGLRHDRASVVGIFEEPMGAYFDRFPRGVVYTIEFEDGASTEAAESTLEEAIADATADSPLTGFGEGR